MVQEAAAQGLAGRLERFLHPQCLTPDAGKVLQELADQGSLAAAIAPDYSIEGGSIEPHHIELRLRDQGDGEVYGVTLYLEGWQSGSIAGRGERFVFQIDEATPPTAAAALQAVARTVDAAIPGTALEPCAGDDAPRADRRYPRRRSLISAALQVIILVASVVWGLRALRLPAHRSS